MIHINDQYAIKVEEKNYVLQEKKVRGKDAKEPGEEYGAVVGYYPSLEWALCGARWCMQRDRLVGETLTLSQTIEALRRVDEEFKKMVAEIMEG